MGRDAIVKTVSPAPAAVLSRLAARSTPLGVYAAVFGGGFVAGAAAAAFFAPVSGVELRKAVRGELEGLWNKSRQQVAELGDEASEEVDRVTEKVTSAVAASRDIGVTTPSEPPPAELTKDELTKDELTKDEPCTQ